MNKTLLAGILVLAILPFATAAPDTPPALTWNIDLPESEGDPCNLNSNLETIVLDIAVANDGYIYTLERCEASDQTAVVRRVSPAGTIVWTQPFGSGTGGDITPYAIDADPAGRVWIWYDDSLEATQTLKLVVRNKLGTPVIVKSNADFSASNPVDSTAFEETGASSFRAYAGGEGGVSIAYDCTAITTCTELYEVHGQPGPGKIHHAQPYFDGLYGGDPNDGSGFNQLILVNQETGLPSIDTASSVWSAAPGAGYNPATAEIGYVGQSTSGGRHNHYQEYNKTTMALIRDVNPIENRVFGYTENNVFEGFIDGAGNAFYCGYATDGGSTFDPYLAKYNTTTNMGMRWNVTFGINSGLEIATDCRLAPDGSIYVGWFTCVTGNQCSSGLRKYLGAATSRTEATVFTENWGGSSSSTTSAAAGNIAAGAKNYCSAAWGFDCGWLFLGAVVGLVALATQNKHVLIIATVLFVAIIIVVKIMDMPEWIILAIVFLIVVFAGITLTRNKEDSD